MCATDTSSPPHYVRHPLKGREDWEKLRPFFGPETLGRVPLNWEEAAARYKDRDYPVGVVVGNLYGWLRDWMGVEALSIAFYRDPDWVGEMMDTRRDSGSLSSAGCCPTSMWTSAPDGWICATTRAPSWGCATSRSSWCPGTGRW